MEKKNNILNFVEGKKKRRENIDQEAEAAGLEDLKKDIFLTKVYVGLPKTATKVEVLVALEKIKKQIESAPDSFFEEDPFNQVL